MIDITNEMCWEEKFEDTKVQKKMSFENRVITIGLILFGICIIINSVLIYVFFSLLSKI